MNTIHAPFETEVECKIAPVRAGSSPISLPDATRCSRCSAEILAGAANPYHAARTRRVSAAGLAPTSGEVVTEFQSDSSRTDSPVRIRYAQPASPVSWDVSWLQKYSRHSRELA